MKRVQKGEYMLNTSNCSLEEDHSHSHHPFSLCLRARGINHGGNELIIAAELSSDLEDWKYAINQVNI